MNIKLGAQVLTVSMVLACGAVKAEAATVVVNTDSSTTAYTTALTGSTTAGDQMDGMTITATFANGTSQTLTWADTGPGSGSVSSSLFSLNTAGDTFNSTWNLNNLSSSLLTSLSINAGLGDTVFDVISDPMLTPGSARGRPFEDQSSNVTGSILATYSTAVALTGFAPAGDLFANLLVDFTGLAGGGLSGAYAFSADTDNLNLSGDLTPIAVPGPIAGAGLPALLALGGFVWARRRKAAAVA